METKTGCSTPTNSRGKEMRYKPANHRRSLIVLTSVIALAFALSAASASAAAAPRVIGVSPAGGHVRGVTSGLTSGGTTVLVRGSGFVAGTSSVTFGSTPAASVQVDSSSQITAVSPAGSAGVVDVQVTTPDGTSQANAGDRFRYVLSIPSDLRLDATGVTQAAIRWQAPAVDGVLGYKVFRDGTLVGTITSPLKTNFLDTGLSANTSYTYTVAASTLAGDTETSSPLQASTGTAQVITQCQGLSSGHYVLGADLTQDQYGGACLYVAGSAANGISIDCNGHKLSSPLPGVPGVRFDQMTGFLLVNCEFPHANPQYITPAGGLYVSDSSYGTVASSSFHGLPSDTRVPSTEPQVRSSSNIAFTNNSLDSSQLSFIDSTDDYVGQNSITASGTLTTAGAIELQGGAGNVVDGNTIDGGISHPDPQFPEQGADDGIVATNEIGDVFANNAIANVWDAGIETAGYSYDTAITGNSIHGAEIAGIGAYHNWESSWFNVSASANTVSDAGMLFLLRTGSYPAPEDTVFFQHNWLDGNILTQPRVSNWGPGLASSIFDTTLHPEVTTVVGDNSITNNNFGAALPAPHVTPGLFTVNSYNFCALAGGQYSQLNCDGSSASAPTVSGVSPSSGSAGTPVTITGTGLSAAGAVTLWQGPGDPSNVTIPNCAASGSNPATCFTVNSDTSITYPAPYVIATSAMHGDLRVSSDAGSSEPTAADEFTLTTPAAPTFTSPADGSVLTTAAVTANFTVPASAPAVYCNLFDYNTSQDVTHGPCAAPSVSYSGLSNGHRYAILLSVADAAGNSSTVMTTFSVQVPPPSVTITSPAEGSTVNSTSLTATFNIVDGGGGIGTTICELYDVTLQQDASWGPCQAPSATFNNISSGHAYWLAVDAWDTFGQLTGAVVNFNADSTPPTLAIDSPTEGQVLSLAAVGTSRTVAVGFTAGADAVSVTCQLDSGVVDTSCTSPKTYTGVTDGSHAETVAATDAAGNTATIVRHFSVDATNPVVSIASPANGSTTPNPSPTLTYNVTESSSHTELCKVDTGSFATCPATLGPLTPGSHTVTVQSTDAAGNVGTAASTFTVDTTPPAVSISAPVDGSVTGSSVTATFTATDTGGSGVASMTCKLDSGTATACNSGQIYSGLSVGSHTIIVSATDNAGNVGTATTSFTYQAAPTVTAVSPVSGPLAAGQSVTITGTNLLGASAVKFGTTAATNVVVNSSTSITATAPAGSSGTVDVTVTTPSGTSAVVAADHYTYQTAPTITAVSPATGSTLGGTSVTITGTNFIGASSVKFGTTAATSYTVNSATSITATAPAHATGQIDVTVTTPSGTSAVVTGDHFTYGAPPAITTISPISGPLAGGTTVTLTGSNFTGATSVKFGATAGTSLTVVSSTSITVKSPAASAGTVDITVTTPYGTSAVVTADRFTYQAAPTVTAVSPVSGPVTAGASVTITGTNFIGASSVKFGTTAATNVVVNSATSITATAPAHTAGQVDVTVTTPSGTSAVVTADHYTYQAAPTVTAVSPTSGSHLGGTSVTITGTNFIGATSVKFGTTAATSFTVTSSTRITVTAPAHATGLIDITVTTPSGTSTVVTADHFTYT